MADDNRQSVEFLLERSGFLRCQVEITDHLISCEKRLLGIIEGYNEEFKAASGLRRQEIKEKIVELKGEVRALRTLWYHVSSLHMPISSLDASKNN